MDLKTIKISTDEDLIKKLQLSLSPFIKELFETVENGLIDSKLQLGVYIGESMVNIVDFFIKEVFNGSANEIAIAVSAMFSSYTDSIGISVKKTNSDNLLKMPSEKSFMVPGDDLKN